MNAPAADGIAIIGMAGRFPGADDIAAFWSLLREGREGITRFTEAELRDAGVPDSLLRLPNYVRAAPVIADHDGFDAGFFGYSAREAALLDPQHRVFLESCWAALEDAGHDCRRPAGRIGVYAGCNMSTYLLENVELDGDVSTLVRRLEILTANDKDYLATRVSYKLGLTGPSLNVATACSTSLVAVILACQHLAEQQCDIALAGGAALTVPHRVGYLHEDSNGALSSDGHCRAFDTRADGCVFGSGVGVVVLRRLADALAAGDHVHAVIRGSALNNDGAAKVGFMAPGVDGQAEAIAESQGIAGFDPATVGLVETHGTGTALGDAIEIAALKRAFGYGLRRGACALGAVKTNIGHLVAASGVTGLIKATLAVEHGEIPATLHFTRPNPALGLEDSPFVVPDRLSPWPAGTTQRRAGVSAFGVGGTNAHVCLEQAPPRPGRRPAAVGPELLVLSACTPAALDNLSTALAARIGQGTAPLSDIAFTLQTGRAQMAQRRCLVAEDAAEATTRLATGGPRVFTGEAPARERPVVFMFGGAGTARPAAIGEIYQSEPAFRAAFDRCAAILCPEIGADIAALVQPGSDWQPERSGGAVGLPLLVSLEVALAALWRSWGVVPAAAIGYSTGEYLAAYQAGVFDLETLLSLTALRGRLLDRIAPGGMILVQLGEAELAPMLPEGAVVAGANTPRQSLVSGPLPALDALQDTLRRAQVACLRSPVAGAAHSPLVEPVLDRFRAAVAACVLHAPRFPWVSTLTGTWITDDQATSPDFWATHLRGTVRFSAAVAALLEPPGRAFLEIGPGDQLCAMLRGQPGFAQGGVALASMTGRRVSGAAAVLETLGRLWTAGVAVDWSGLARPKKPLRVKLPTYPFERVRHWVEKSARRAVPVGLTDAGTGCLYHPRWREARLPDAAPLQPGHTLILGGAPWLAETLRTRFTAAGQAVTLMREDAAGAVRQEGGTWHADPENRTHQTRLLAGLAAEGRFPDRIIAAWPTDPCGPEGDHASLAKLLALLGALAQHEAASPLRLAVLAPGALDLLLDGSADPGRAMLAPVLKVVPRELPLVSAQLIDLPTGPPLGAPLADRLVAELGAPVREALVAYRGPARFVEDFAPAPAAPGPVPYRAGGAYLITGGLGGIGAALAVDLARRFQAKLLLVGRTELPPPDTWESWLRAHAAEESVAQRLLRLRRIREAGGTVETAAADVADRDAIARLLRAFRARHGRLDGVFHFAGAIERDKFALLADTTPETLAGNLRAKVDGTLVLAELLRPDPPDFCLLASSLAAVFGGLGNAAYAAANQFLDAFARRERALTGAVWTSVNWTYWLREGSDAEAVSGAHRRTIEGMFRDRVVTTTEGLALIEHVLSRPEEPQWTVSREPPALRLALQIGPGVEERRPGGAARPALSTPYVAPQTGQERAIATVWEEVLGCAPIGLHDSFFELGGDSLTAVRLAQKLRDGLGLQIQLRRMVEDPTIAGIIESIEAAPEFGQAASLLRLRSAADAAVRRSLVCFPYAGGNAIMYRPMADALPHGFDVFALDIPGHDYDEGQMSVAMTEEIAFTCVREIERLVEGPVELYGHCGGTVLAMEVARQLEVAGCRVDAVFAGAVTPLSRDGGEERGVMRRLERISDRELRRFLRRLGGIDDTLDPTALNFVVNSFRRDAMETFAYYRRVCDEKERRRLAAPFYCIVGDDDPLVKDYRKRVQYWKAFAERVSFAVIRGGGHYFVREQPAEVASLIAAPGRFAPC
jgi:phthiocerol/phenolphthiocerol synthesis type-I polyketide synthase E